MEYFKVVIVDDDLDWLKAMTRFLNHCGDFLVVGTAVDRQGAVQLSQNCEFDVMLLDINLNGNKLDGIYAAMEILSSTPVRIIMLTSLHEAEIITESFAAGAVSFVAKDHFTEIPTVIRNVIQSNFPMEALLNDYRRLRKEEQLWRLTPAELEIFKLAEQGYKRAEIGDRLFKSENTIKKQIKLILQKLKVANLQEAIQKIHHKAVVADEEPTTMEYWVLEEENPK